MVNPILPIPFAVDTNIAESQARLGEAKDDQTIQVSEWLTTYGQQVEKTIDAESRENIEEFKLPPGVEAKRVQLVKMETSFETDKSYRTPENYKIYQLLYTEFQNLAAPLYEAKIAEHKEKEDIAEKKWSSINRALNQKVNNDDLRKEWNADSDRQWKISGEHAAAAKLLTAELREILAGPALGHCSIEDKSAEVKRVEKLLQLWARDNKGRSYVISTDNDEYASSLASKKRIELYSYYSKGDALYFTYKKKKTGKVVTFQYGLNNDGDKILKFKKTPDTNDKWEKSNNEWDLPNPPANKSIGMKG